MPRRAYQRVSRQPGQSSNLPDRPLMISTDSASSRAVRESTGVCAASASWLTSI